MKKLFAMTVAVLLLFSVLLGIPAAYGQAPETGKTLDILFSHDTHSHLNTFTTVVEDEESRDWRLCPRQHPHQGTARQRPGHPCDRRR